MEKGSRRQLGNVLPGPEKGVGEREGRTREREQQVSGKVQLNWSVGWLVGCSVAGPGQLQPQFQYEPRIPDNRSISNTIPWFQGM